MCAISTQRRRRSSRRPMSRSPNSARRSPARGSRRRSARSPKRSITSTCTSTPTCWIARSSPTIQPPSQTALIWRRRWPVSGRSSRRERSGPWLSSRSIPPGLMGRPRWDLVWHCCARPSPPGRHSPVIDEVGETKRGERPAPAVALGERLVSFKRFYRWLNLTLVQQALWPLLVLLTAARGDSPEATPMPWYLARIGAPALAAALAFVYLRQAPPSQAPGAAPDRVLAPEGRATK